MAIFSKYLYFHLDTENKSICHMSANQADGCPVNNSSGFPDIINQLCLS